MNIKLIILDFDGVIVESLDVKTESFRELFKNNEKVDEIIRYHHNNRAFSRFVKFKHIYENILGKEYNEQVAKELGEKFSEIVFQKVVACPMVAGAENFLKIFSRTYPIYLISATPQEELERIVASRNLDGFFKQVWGIPPGNKIDYINHALKNENARPEEAVSIGDTREDFNVAQKTGVRFVGRINQESFDDLGVPVFPDMNGIAKWLQKKGL